MTDLKTHMFRLTKILVLTFLLYDRALSQSPQELAATAAAAMNARDYSKAEDCYRRLMKLVPDSGELSSNLGLAFYFQGKFDNAQTAFWSALKRKPDLYVPNFFLGRIYFDRSEYRAALPLLEAAWRSQPAQQDARRLLAAALVGLGRFPEAVEHFQELIREDPKNVDAHYSLGLVYSELGRKTVDRLLQFKDSGFISLLRAEFYSELPEWSELAETSFHQAIARLPGVPSLHSRFGEFLVKKGRLGEATVAFQKELQTDPNSCEAHFGLATVALQSGDFEGCVRELNVAASIRPEFFEEWRPLTSGQSSDARAKVWLEQEARQDNFGAAYLLAQLTRHASERQNASARQTVSRLRARLWENRTPAPVQSDTMQRRIEAGINCVAQRRYEEGISILEALPPAVKTRPDIQTALARALSGSGRYEDVVGFVAKSATSNPELVYLLATGYRQLAVAALQRTVELNPESAHAHKLHGDSLAARGRLTEAKGAYEAAAKLESRDPELYFLLGNTRSQTSDFDGAAAAYRRVVELSPLNSEAHLMWGVTELRAGHPDEAIRLLRKALDLNPTLLRAEAFLGKAFALKGNTAEAIEHVKRGAMVDNDGSTYYQLATLYREVGQEEKAREALERHKTLRSQHNRRTIDLTVPDAATTPSTPLVP
jgi:tetratricopeptide (TPR) repeat protein